MCLITTMFYTLLPQFIVEKRLCWLRAPLYKLSKNNISYYAYDDEDLAALKTKYSGFSQSRIKGLGELSAKDVAASILHPENRRVEVLASDDIQKTGSLLNLFMGVDVAPRKDFLFANADFKQVM